MMVRQASHVAVFSSEMLPERDRFEAFREEFNSKWSRVEVINRGEGPLVAHLRSVRLGLGVIVEIKSSPAAYARTRSHDELNDDFVFSISGHSSYFSRQSDRILHHGEGALGDRARIGCTINDHDAIGIGFSFPRKPFLALLPHAEDIGKLPTISRDQPELVLIRNYIATLLTMPGIAPDTLQAAGHHLCDLIALALGASGEAAQAASAGSLRAARSAAARQQVVEHLRNPRLTIAEVARAQGISERYLRRLFADSETSFSDFLVEQRLALAYRLLASPLGSERRISEVAYECGFSDLSHFNRRFRQRYGATPGDIRADSSSRR